MSGLIIAVPSKGRLKEQVEGWLADCGLKLELTGGARGYLASLNGVAGAQVRLLSAADISDALDAGAAQERPSTAEVRERLGTHAHRHVPAGPG